MIEKNSMDIESAQSMTTIGGYFELELNKGLEYHPGAIRLNTGRNAFEYILKGRGYKRVYLPYYTCETMLQPITKLGLEYQFYHIDTNFEPLFDISKIHEDEAFLYTNYYGLKDRCVEALSQVACNLIVDNAQAFFSKPTPGIDVFYSPRKFFGLPDGAYLYSNVSFHEPLEQDHSDLRFEHLLERVEYGAEVGFCSFLNNSRNLNSLPIRRMSNLTQRLLMNIDYQQVLMTRRDNFLVLQNSLAVFNKFEFELTDTQVPMIYPFYGKVPGMRQRLIEKRIYVAQYWPNVLKWTSSNDVEYDYTQNLIPLPIDQRYSVDDMECIVAVVRGISP